jgi:hypothetical protein
VTIRSAPNAACSSRVPRLWHRPPGRARKRQLAAGRALHRPAARRPSWGRSRPRRSASPSPRHSEPRRAAVIQDVDGHHPACGARAERSKERLTKCPHLTVRVRWRESLRVSICIWRVAMRRCWARPTRVLDAEAPLVAVRFEPNGRVTEQGRLEGRARGSGEPDPRASRCGGAARLRPWRPTMRRPDARSHGCGQRIVPCVPRLRSAARHVTCPRGPAWRPLPARQADEAG